MDTSQHVLHGWIILHLAARGLRKVLHDIEEHLLSQQRAKTHPPVLPCSRVEAVGKCLQVHLTRKPSLRGKLFMTTSLLESGCSGGYDIKHSWDPCLHPVCTVAFGNPPYALLNHAHVSDVDCPKHFKFCLEPHTQPDPS